MSTQYRYEYYLVIDPNPMPVRILFNARGLKAGAQVPDPKTGKLIYWHVYMRYVFGDMNFFGEVEEISEDEFVKRCREEFGVVVD